MYVCMYVYIFYIYTASYYSVCIGLRYSCGYIVMFGHLRVKLPFRPLGQPRLEILEPRPSPKPSSSAIHLHYPLVIGYIAIKNGHRNSGFTHWKRWFSIVMLTFTKGYCSWSSIIPLIIHRFTSNVSTWFHLKERFGSQHLLGIEISMWCRQEKKEQLKEDLRDKTSALHIDLNCLTHESVAGRQWSSQNIPAMFTDLLKRKIKTKEESW